tara:strand:- start:138 stop:377 length:240 start_codon:yes stop_codon:yes gene_type:complete
MKSLSNTIFYIKYFATKYGETIERKATLDDKAKGEYVCKRGYPCFNYVDLNATEKFGKTQYRTASFKWEINEQPTMLYD